MAAADAGFDLFRNGLRRGATDRRSGDQGQGLRHAHTWRCEQRGNQTGKVDFLSLIDSVRAIEAVHIEHIQAAADFEKAYADLERAVGTELPRKNDH